MSAGTDSDILLKNPDPFKFRNEGLAGKVIGAQFLIIFLMIVVVLIGGYKAVRLAEQVIASNSNVGEALKGLSITVYEFSQSVDELSGRSRRRAPPAAPKGSDHGQD